MNVISSPSRNETAELAYFYFLERQRLGLPDDPQNDWENAEADLRKGGSTTLAPEPSMNRVPLSHIKGIGPRVTASLNDCGVHSANDLAHWSLSDFGEKLPRLTARARNGEWIEQAKALVS
jgi:predicted flap endonuclease-1-like 5' DNA nuclease